MKLICQTEEGNSVLLVIEGLQIVSIKQININNVVSPTLNDILLDVSSKTGIPIQSLKSSSRFRQIVDARCVYFRRAREITKLSTASIGLEVNKDHATVIHGAIKAETVREVIELYDRCYPDKQKQPIQDLTLKSPVLKPLTNPVVSTYTKEEFEPVRRVKNDSYGIKPFMGYVSRARAVS